MISDANPKTPSKTELAGYGTATPDDPERKVDMRTKEGRALKAASQLARESEKEAHRESAEQQAEREKQIGAAVGNMNDTQLFRRNEIADQLDKTRGFDEEDTEKAALETEAQAEAERQRLEAEANERAAKDEQDAGVVEAEPKKFKLKVNGKDVEMTEAEVLERAQKVAAADEYLQMAARAVEQSRALAPSQDEPVSAEEDRIEDTLTSALQGDREAIGKVAQRLKAPSTVDVLRAVDDRMSFRSAVSWFQGEYKDVVDDPMLYRLVVDEDARLAKSEPAMSYQERLKRAGDHVRGWKQGIVKSMTPVNPKLERKAAAPSVPSATQRQAAPEDEDAEEPVESVIEKMARARNQNGAVRR
ncbi:MAG TPA: hypothetical protein VGS04_05120 [Nitrososphaerales archaeon]|nr:hypothetical protein [Nitrososphaerales archaeon]